MPNPELSANSSVMANFLDIHENAAMGQLVALDGALSQLFKLSEGNKNSLLSITQTSKDFLNQLYDLDSIAASQPSPELEEINIAKRDSIAELLEGGQKAADSLIHEIGVGLQQQGAIMLATLNSIVPTNDFEFNEKYVLGVYLNFLVSGNQSLPGTVDSLYNIGRECLFVSGPCVYNARSLYGRMTGIALPEVDCPLVENRNKENISSANTTLPNVLIYPNPANDILSIRLLAGNGYWPSHVKISNVLGKLMLETKIQAGENEVSTKNLPSGAYFVQVVQNGVEVLTTTVFIQH
jgi:hypothetical protein